jgi:hypothetical protein
MTATDPSATAIIPAASTAAGHGNPNRIGRSVVGPQPPVEWTGAPPQPAG